MFISVTTQFTTRESPCGELSSYNVMLFFLKKILMMRLLFAKKYYLCN